MAKIPLKEIVFPGLDNTYTIPEIDSTLSTAGKAADAKETGDKISELKEDTTQLKNTLSDLGLSVVDGAINITYEEVSA